MAIKRSYVLPEDSSMITWRHVYESSLRLSLLVGGKRDAPGNAPASLFKLVVLLLFSCNVPPATSSASCAASLFMYCPSPCCLCCCSFHVPSPCCFWCYCSVHSDRGSKPIFTPLTWIPFPGYHQRGHGLRRLLIVNQSHARVILLKEKYLCWTVTHYLLITLQWTGDNVSVARTVGVATASFITFENVENADNKLLLTLTYGFSTMLRMLRMLITISSCCS